jgi:hypothetical protein
MHAAAAIPETMRRCCFLSIQEPFFREVYFALRTRRR